MQQMIFIADLIACSTCFGHHYAHHQELEGIIQMVAACGIWCLVFKLSVWRGAEGYMFVLWFSSCRYVVELRVMCLCFGFQVVGMVWS